MMNCLSINSISQKFDYVKLVEANKFSLSLCLLNTHDDFIQFKIACVYQKGVDASILDNQKSFIFIRQKITARFIYHFMYDCCSLLTQAVLRCRILRIQQTMLYVAHCHIGIALKGTL